MFRHVLAVTFLLFLGCTQPQPEPPDPPAPDPDPDPVDLPSPDDIELEGSCSLTDRFGGFRIEEFADYTMLQGQIADGVVPASVLEPIYSENDCVLLRRNNPFCDPICDTDETCNFDGECVPFPQPQDLAMVAVDGLNDPLRIEPAMPGFNYFATDLSHPAMTAGETIRIQTGEGTWSPIELWGVGVETLGLQQDEPWRIGRGDPVELAWLPPAGDSWAEIYFQLNIDQHGTSPVTLECSFADAGSATVPSSLIDALLDSGVSGWPSARIARRTADAATAGEGCADLVVSSTRDVAVELADYIPCDESHPCPEGMECNLDIGLCQ